MMQAGMAPEVRYAHNGDVSIAWSESGGGPIDLVFMTGVMSHVDHLWEEPALAGFLERLGRFSRLILVDRRGTGLSDRVTAPVELDDEVEDLRAVLDAAGSPRAVVLGYTTAAALGIRFARLLPERTQALVLYAPIASSVRHDDYPFTHTEAERAAMTERRIAEWGTGVILDVAAPSRAHDPRKREWMAKMERLSSSPGSLRALLASQVDVRGDVRHVRVPTLVLQRTHDRLVDVAHARWVAERIPGARLVELPGEDSLPSAGDAGALVDEIEEFLTGSRGLTRERALLTVLFTDLVDSTRTVAALGDARWSELLNAHASAVRREVERAGGRPVKSIGDGLLATFDGAPSRALRASLAARDAVAALGLRMRAGLHTGECETLGDDVGGMAVHIAARVAALAGPGEVLASGTAYGTVVGSGLRFEERGMVPLRGVPGRWPIFALLSGD